jgi:hypothetical protein
LPVSTLRALSDDALLARLDALVAQERESMVDVVEHLMEMERRELAVDRAYPSLFIYCVKKLGYSEAAAFARIRAARAAARFPDVLIRLRSGDLHLDSVVRLYPYLDQENCAQLLEQASGASKMEVLTLVAELQPEPEARRDVIVPVAPSRAEPTAEAAHILAPPQHRFHFTADAELLHLVEKLRGHLRHKIPDGRLESIFKEAAQSLLARIEREKNVLTQPTRSKVVRQGSRFVPKGIKREVWTREGGRCAYSDPSGRRCESREALEYDHIVAWADGGRSDTTDNIRLLCRAHNQRLGRRRFGPRRAF